jgi:hypothetical protein
MCGFFFTIISSSFFYDTVVSSMHLQADAVVGYEARALGFFSGDTLRITTYAK